MSATTANVDVMRRWAKAAPDLTSSCRNCYHVKDAFLCTRDLGHSGPHAFYSPIRDYPYAVWPMDDGSTLELDQNLVRYALGQEYPP